MFKSLLFFNLNWDEKNLCCQIDGSNVYPPNVGEKIILSVQGVSYTFVVCERLFDYTQSAVFVRVKMAPESFGKFVSNN